MGAVAPPPNAPAPGGNAKQRRAEKRAAEKEQKRIAVQNQQAAAQKEADKQARVAAAKAKAKGKGKAQPTHKPQPKSGNKKKHPDVLCKHYRDHAKHGNCPKGKDCDFCHNKKRFMKKDGTFSKKPIKAAPQGPGNKQGAIEEPVVDDSNNAEHPDNLPAWDQPLGISAIRHIMGTSQMAAAKPKPRSGDIKTLAELPEKVWTKVANFHEGTQFYTRVGLGDQETQMMLDGGSAVNSVTEEQVVATLNHYRAKNIPLSDKRHPVLQLEKWPEEESVRGVAGGVTVKLVGSVVFRIKMYRKGTNEGPEVRIRFKITQAGSTDWVGMIVGAHAIDHSARGGLGHQPAANGHWMSTLNIMMDRID